MSQIHIGDAFEIGDKVVLGLQRQEHSLSTCQQRSSCVDGIARVGYQSDISRIKECEAEVVDGLL